jgi:hypothetical protein
MYELEPFKKNTQTSKISIFSEAFKDGNDLLINFIIEDKNKTILTDEYNKAPTRKYELWKTTCFEAFFGIEGSSGYWELNFSVSGNWNIFYFDSYRTPGQPKEEAKVTKISVHTTYEDFMWRVEVKVPIQSLGLQTKKLEVGLASVIEYKNKEKSYFALKHGVEKPDFHQRESFICNLG